ncbi:MAG TPA: 50S ribosomal protein L35 [Candidatus Paceibacterota bacterium]|nr:50S ribosomal protein L35 [Candidatus Paceibacterota bacterium]
MSGKTRKSVVKRFKITKNKKLMYRLPHQNHLNAKQSGNKKRAKRHSKRVESKTKMVRNIVEFRNM